MNHTSLCLAAAVMMTAGTATAATSNLIDFENLGTGQGLITGNEAELDGVTISITDPFGAAGNTPYNLGVYNSACRTNCTGGDLDLATGTGITASPIKAEQDTPAEDYILITSAGTGDNFGDRVSKARFTFTFDLPSIVDSLTLIDIDEVANSVSIIFNFSDGSISSFLGSNPTSVLNADKDNAYSFFDIRNDADLLPFHKTVNSFSIQFGTQDSRGISGGIAGFAYTPVPVPAALPLLAGAIGLLGFAARRRKAA